MDILRSRRGLGLRPALLALVLLLALVAAACGTDEEAADDADAESSDDEATDDDAEAADDEAADDEAAADDTEGEDTLARLQEQGYVQIAFANEPPYSEIGEDGTSITGGAVEVPRAVMEKLGVPEVDGTVIAYDSMIPGLKAGRFDMVTAGLFMTPERCQEVIYSEPDVCGTESFAVPEGNPLGLDSYASLAEQDATVGVPGGSVEEQYAEEAGVEDIQIIPDSRSGIESLQAGRIDAYALPSLSIKDLLEEGDGLEEVGPLEDVPVSCAGAAFRPEDEDFRDAYNEALAELQESGEFTEILEEFGFPGDIPQEVTSEELCAGEG